MLGIDAVDGERGRFETCAFKRFDVIAKSRSTNQGTVVMVIDQDRGDFEQGIGFGIETACFHVHGDGQETAKPISNRKGVGHFQSASPSAFLSISKFVV